MTDELLLKVIHKELEHIELEEPITQVERLEVVKPNLLTLRCQLQRELYEKREQLRMPNYKYNPKDKDTPRYTDFDRRTMLEAQTAEINERYELVKGLEELVKERVDLIKILLRDK